MVLTIIILFIMLILMIGLYLYKIIEIEELKKANQFSESEKFDEENKYFLSRLDKKDEKIKKLIEKLENALVEKIAVNKLNEELKQKIKEKNVIINRYKQRIVRRDKKIKKITK